MSRPADWCPWYAGMLSVLISCLAQAAEDVIVIESEFNSDIPAFSPGGRQLAVWGQQHLRILDSQSGKTVREFPEVKAAMQGLFWTPDGKEIVTYGDAVYFWDAASGKQVSSITSGDYCSSAAMSSDGTWLALGYTNGDVVVTTRDKRRSTTLKGHSGRIVALAWAGNKLYSAGGFGDGMVLIWNPEESQLLGKMVAHSNEVKAMTLGTSGEFFYALVGDSEVWQHSMVTGHRIRQFEGASFASSIAVNSAGKLVASSQENDLILWGPDGKRLRKLSGHDGWIRKIEFSPDGSLVASAGGNSLRIWKVAGADARSETGEPEKVGTTDAPRVLDALDGAVFGLDVSPDGKLLAASSSTDPARVLVWSLPDRELIGSIPAGGPPLQDVRFARTGTMLVFQNSVGHLVTWDTRRRQQLREIPVENSGSGRFVLSRSGRHALLATPFGAQWIELKSGRSVTTVEGHAERVRDVVLAPDEQAFATGDEAGRVVLWDLKTAKKLGELPPQGEAVHSLAWSPDGTLLAVGSLRSVLLWDVSTQSTRHSLPAAPEYPRDLVFSPDSQLICAVGYPKDVRMWNTHSAKVVADLKGHTAEVDAVAFSPDGETLVTGGSDKSIRLWDTSSLASQPASTNPIGASAASIVTRRINDLENWEVVRGEWKQENGRIVGSGNSRLNFKDSLRSEFTFRAKMRVIEGMRPRIRFGSFHFGNEGPERLLFLHGPRATGTRTPYNLNQEVQVEVVIAGGEAMLKLDGKEVARSSPKELEERTISLETGGTAIPGVVEFYDFELLLDDQDR